MMNAVADDAGALIPHSTFTNLAAVVSHYSAACKNINYYIKSIEMLTKTYDFSCATQSVNGDRRKNFGQYHPHERTNWYMTENLTLQ